MPTFKPFSPSEYEDKYELLPPGDYDFEVTSAKEKTSKSGSEMIELTLTIPVKDREYKVWDYLVFSEKSFWKLAAFAQAVGLEKAVEAGELAAFDCEGKSGSVRIITEKSDQGESSKVKTYLSRPATPTPIDKDGDSIPF